MAAASPEKPSVGDGEDQEKEMAYAEVRQLSDQALEDKEKRTQNAISSGTKLPPNGDPCERIVRSRPADSSGLASDSNTKRVTKADFLFAFGIGVKPMNLSHEELDNLANMEKISSDNGDNRICEPSPNPTPSHKRKGGTQETFTMPLRSRKEKAAKQPAIISGTSLRPDQTAAAQDASTYLIDSIEGTCTVLKASINWGRAQHDQLAAMEKRAQEAELKAAHEADTRKRLEQELVDKDKIIAALKKDNAEPAGQKS